MFWHWDIGKSIVYNQEARRNFFLISYSQDQIEERTHTMPWSSQLTLAITVEVFQQEVYIHF